MAQGRVHVIVSGRVQGVGFRYFVQREASRLGLKGFVRNVSRAQLEVVAEGEQAALDEFVNEVGEGPPGARVENVQLSRQTPAGDFRSFEVRASSG
ncbi:MAG: acylphosphatase [Armatimonadia bacterium]